MASALNIAEAGVEAMALKTAAESDVRACVDQGQVRARLDTLAAHPRLSGRPDIVGHCAKVALIRLVELSAYEEALTLFRDRWDEAWLAEEAVASALDIAETAVEVMALKTAAESDVRACVDQGQVRARLDTIAAHPRLSGRPDIVGHCAKVALIRLVELSAYEEALTLFRDRGDETWMAEGAVASALDIAEAAVEVMALKTATESDVRACVDQGQVRARLDTIAAHPRLSGRPDIVGHCAKVALIRLVELSAYEEALTLFRDRGDEAWMAEGAVASALDIAEAAVEVMALKAAAESDLRACVDKEQVRARLDTLAAAPLLSERPDIIRHCAKVALIQLVQMSAHRQAEAVYQKFGDDTWKQDAPVAGALAQIKPRGRFRRT
ncbi:MAG: hypothetical protein PW843_29915 [Azospirillaceae bacterium]|nr:hypothetical protein [Azospirillaceae bacterium]